jgi:hypothetical protein
VSTLTAEGEGARQAVVAVQPGGPVTVPVTAEDLRELLGLANQDSATRRKQAKGFQGKLALPPCRCGWRAVRGAPHRPRSGSVTLGWT